MRIKLIMGIFISLLTLSCLYSAEITKPESYILKVKIEPASGEIFVDGKVLIVLKDTKQRDFSFDLHETFIIEKLLVNGKVAKYSTEKKEPWPIQPAAKKVIVEIPESNNQRKIEMAINYHGRLKDIPEFGSSEDQELALDDQINTRMVELAVYSCWYPYFEFGIKFDVDLEISLPINWKHVCSGVELESKEINDRIITHWTSKKDTDLVIVASPDFKRKSIKTSTATIDIYFNQLPKQYISKEANGIEETLKFFSLLLGKPHITGGLIKHVYSPKSKGQGQFARPGMIVASEGRTLDSISKNPKFSFVKGIAREIAHFWWSFATGQGDWINETFAEYFSLVAVQKISSNKEFRDYLKRIKKYVDELPEDAPALSKVPFSNDEIGYVVRYYKGALMLDYFRNILGDKTFFEICRDFYQKYNKTVIGTAEFRSFWEERLGEHKKLLNIWLDSKGGLPEIKELN